MGYEESRLPTADSHMQKRFFAPLQCPTGVWASEGQLGESAAVVLGKPAWGHFT
jgi:hypothetical protein